MKKIMHEMGWGQATLAKGSGKNSVGVTSGLRSRMRVAGNNANIRQIS